MEIFSAWSVSCMCVCLKAFQYGWGCVCVSVRRGKSRTDWLIVSLRATHLIAEVLLPTGLTGRGLITGKRAWLLTRAPFWMTPRGTKKRRKHKVSGKSVPWNTENSVLRMKENTRSLFQNLFELRQDLRAARWAFTDRLRRPTGQYWWARRG